MGCNGSIAAALPTARPGVAATLAAALPTARPGVAATLAAALRVFAAARLAGHWISSTGDARKVGLTNHRRNDASTGDYVTQPCGRLTPKSATGGPLVGKMPLTVGWSTSDSRLLAARRRRRLPEQADAG